MKINWYFWGGIISGFLLMRQVIAPMFPGLFLGGAEDDLKKLFAKGTPAQRAKARQDYLAAGFNPSQLARVGL